MISIVHSAGEIVDSIPLPTPLILAPIFGGENNSVLYVSSGTVPIDFTDNEFEPQRHDPDSGVLFQIEGLGVQGVPAYRLVL